MRASRCWWRPAGVVVVTACLAAACTGGGGEGSTGTSAGGARPGAPGSSTTIGAGTFDAPVPSPASPGLACGGGTAAGSRTGPGSQLGTPVRIMPLGDSVTIGMHGTGADWDRNKSLRGGYRARLQELLDASAVSYEMVGGSDAVDPREELPCQGHQGHGGWCVRGGDGYCFADDYAPGGDGGLTGHVARWLEAANPDIVLLHAGTNDVNGGRSSTALAEDYEELIDEILSAQPEVYLFVSNLYVEGRDDVNVTFNGRLADLVREASTRHPGQVAFIDTYAGAPEPITGDDANGLHPSLDAYEVMGENWFNALWAALPGLFPTGAAPVGDATPDQVATAPATPDVQPVGQIPSAGAFRLVAQQEFEGRSLDTGTWNVGPPWGGQFCQGREYFVDNAFDISDGLLRIFFRQRDEPIDHCGITRTYDTAMLQTKGKLTVRSGQFLEMRVRAAAGDGFWSMGWVLPESWPDDQCRTQQYELDIFEHLGKDPANLNQAAHVRATCEDLLKDQASVPAEAGRDYTSRFHVMGVDWQEDQVVYYVDGRQTFRSANFGGHDEPGFVLLNGFLGRPDDEWAGPESASTPSTAEFQVDYVRVWERAEPSPAG